MSLLINPNIPEEQRKKIKDVFNEKLEECDEIMRDGPNFTRDALLELKKYELLFPTPSEAEKYFQSGIFFSSKAERQFKRLNKEYGQRLMTSLSCLKSNPNKGQNCQKELSLLSESAYKVAKEILWTDMCHIVMENM
jgi:hypothetical protein